MMAEIGCGVLEKRFDTVDHQIYTVSKIESLWDLWNFK